MQEAGSETDSLERSIPENFFDSSHALPGRTRVRWHTSFTDAPPTICSSLSKAVLRSASITLGNNVTVSGTFALTPARRAQRRVALAAATRSDSRYPFENRTGFLFTKQYYLSVLISSLRLTHQKRRGNSSPRGASVEKEFQ